MASPFRAFRKNQKLLMAIATILAMVAFIFMGPWNSGGPSNTQQKNPDVFSWKYGTVKLADLQYQIGVRQAVNAFLVAVARQLNTPQSMMMTQSLSNPTPESVIDTILFAKKAEELGIVATDANVNQYLESWTERKLSSEALAQILQSVSVSRNHHLTQLELFDTLRTNIQAIYGQQALLQPVAARRNQRFYQFFGDTPADRWEYYCQVNRKATAHVYPVAVVDFISEIPDPSENVLRDFYQQHKNQLANPKSPTPGFKQPYKAQFQYFKADYAKLLAEETAKVTEEEIKKDYEDYKDRDFRKKQLPELSPKEDAPPKDKSDIPPSEPKTPAAETKPDAAKTPDVKPEAKQPSPAEAPKKSDGKAAPSGKKSSSLNQVNSLNGEFLALADEQLIAQTNPVPDTKKSGAGAKTEGGSKKADESPGSPDAKTSNSEIPSTTTVPPVEYEPLESVREQIKKRLAEQKVSDRVQKAFKALTERMDKYRSELGRFNAKIGSEPKSLDFKALADEFGLEAKETPMISDRQAYDETDIGRSSAMISYSNMPFVQMAFGNRPVPTFEPKETYDNEQNGYLWWKIADEASKTPTLEEIKEDVVRAWKMIEARKPAKAKADELAERVRKADQPMRDVLAGLEVITAGPFSWLDRNLGQVPQLSEVSGVKDPSNEFMKTVFSLAAGEVGVAPNYPQNAFYVVQVEGTEPPLDVLENGFMSAMSNPALMQTYASVAAFDHNSDPYHWYKEMQAQFEFQRAPDSEVLQGNVDE